MIKVSGKGGIEAVIVADSKSSVDDQRITTFLLTYHRYVHCFDDKTEILARKDDKSFPIFMSFQEAMKHNCEVAQITYEQKASFVRPTKWISQDFKGELVSLEHKNLNFCVTDGHRLFVGSRKKDRDEREIVIASEMLGNHTQKRFYKTAELLETKAIDPDLAKLLAFFISDGTLPKYGTQAIFRFKKDRKICEVERLLKSLGKEYEKREYGDGTVNIVFSRFPWMEQCYDDFKSESRSKCIPVEFFDMSQQAFSHFMQGLLESDGNVDNQDFNTHSSILIEQLQAMFHLHGKAFNIKCYDGCYKVKFQTEDEPIIRRDKHRAKLIEYSGKVYCCNVPTGLILVRRNGVVHISGNCELMTHRMFSRNAMSSRAVPVKTMLELVKSNPATPIHWGKNQPGMQAKEEVENWKDFGQGEYQWLGASCEAIKRAGTLAEQGYHKQIVNRLVEPFQMIRVLVTATSFDNFFNLRFHEDAQPEIFELARCMLAAYKRSEPELLHPGEWHTPFVKHNRMFGEKDGKLLYSVEDKEGFSEYLSVEDAIKVSCSCSAQTSYRKADTSIEKALSIYEKLIGSDPAHSSAFEHCATPMKYPNSSETFVYDCASYPEPDKGMTHEDIEGNYWSNNFKGWIQYRALIPNNVCVTFDYSREVDEDGLTITDTEEI